MGSYGIDIGSVGGLPIPYGGSLPMRSLDGAGRVGLNTIFGDILTVVREPDVALRWPYNINTIDNVTTTTGSGTVATVGDMATVSTGTTVSSVAQLNSVNLIRYRPGAEIFCFFTTIFTCSGSPGSQQGIDGSTQAVGIFDTDDGFAIGFDGTQFGIRWRVGSVDTWIPQSDFNHDQLTKIDLTKIQLWRISFGWFGGAPVYFEYVNNGAWTLFHVINIANTISSVSIHNPSLPATIESISSTSTTDVTVKVGCIEGGAARPPNAMDVGYRHFNASSGLTLKNLASGTNTPMISLKNPTTFQGVTNKTVVSVFGGTATVISTSTVAGRFTAVLDATLTGASFSSVDTVNSVTQIDTSASAVTGGQSARFGVSLANGTIVIDLNGGHIRIQPGHTLTIFGTATGTATGLIDINWREEY